MTSWFGAADAASSEDDDEGDEESTLLGIRRRLGYAPSKPKHCAWMPELSYSARLGGFAITFMLGVLLSLTSFSSFGSVLLGNPGPWAFKYTLGNVFSISSYCFLVGPARQCSGMFAAERRLYTLLYLGTLSTTLFCVCAYSALEGLALRRPCPSSVAQLTHVRMPMARRRARATVVDSLPSQLALDHAVDLRPVHRHDALRPLVAACRDGPVASVAVDGMLIAHATLRWCGLSAVDQMRAGSSLLVPWIGVDGRPALPAVCPRERPREGSRACLIGGWAFNFLKQRRWVPRPPAGGVR